MLVPSEFFRNFSLFWCQLSFDNQTHLHKMKKEQQTLYVSPQVKTVEIKTQAIICQSGGINNMTIDGDGGDYFE